MNRTLLSIMLIASFFRANSQDDSTILKMPFKDNHVIYEKVFFVDSINDQVKIFNAVKTSLIKNTNYKSAKVDEDRTSGNITTDIMFLFSAKPGIAKIILDAKSKLSIDVKANRFRVRLYDNSASFTLMGQAVLYELTKSYLYEKDQIEKGNWRQNKSVSLPWNEKLNEILNGFGSIVFKNINDEF